MFPLVDEWHLMLGIMAGMIQKDFSVVKIINILVVAQRLFRMVQTVLRTIAIPQLRVHKVSMSLLWSSTSLSWHRGRFP